MTLKLVCQDNPELENQVLSIIASNLDIETETEQRKQVFRRFEDRLATVKAMRTPYGPKHQQRRDRPFWFERKKALITKLERKIEQLEPEYTIFMLANLFRHGDEFTPDFIGLKA